MKVPIIYEKEPFDIKERLNKTNQSGVFNCSLYTFKKIYRLEKRRCEENQQKLFLISYCFSDNDDVQRLKLAIKILSWIFNNYLRSSDVITGKEEGYFMQLVTLPSAARVDIITDRIKFKFREEYPYSDIKLKCSYQEVTNKGE